MLSLSRAANIFLSLEFTSILFLAIFDTHTLHFYEDLLMFCFILSPFAFCL